VATVKTSSIQTMPMLVDKHHYSVCFYHSIGCYFAVEHGLARDGTLEEYSSFLFPNLHSVKDKQVAEKITLIIQSNLQEIVHGEVHPSGSHYTNIDGYVYRLCRPIGT